MVALAATDRWRYMRTMNKKIIILICSTLIFAIATVYFGVQYIRFKDRNMYHRSRMFEYELLANLYRIFPVGTSLDFFLSQVKLGRSAILNTLQSRAVIIDILPELPIPKNEQRDYSGYYVEFTEGKLTKFTPVGPDVARNTIKLSELDIGKEIHYFQKP